MSFASACRSTLLAEQSWDAGTLGRWEAGRLGHRILWRQVSNLPAVFLVFLLAGATTLAAEAPSLRVSLEPQRLDVEDEDRGAVLGRRWRIPIACVRYVQRRTMRKLSS